VFDIRKPNIILINQWFHEIKEIPQSILELLHEIKEIPQSILEQHKEASK